MFKKKREYTNQLTELIKANPNIDPEIVFTHEQLSITIRNEAPVFLDYIFPFEKMEKDESTLENYKKIINYALTTDTYLFPDDNSNHRILTLVNQNAASFLSSPSKRLYELVNKDPEKLLFKKLRNFINDEKSSKDSTAAGNFSRIFIMWFTKNPQEFEHDSYDDNFTIDRLIEFCVDHIRELAYAELLERFLTTEFDKKTVDKTRTKVLYKILKKIRDIIGKKIIIDEIVDEKDSITYFQNPYHKSNSDLKGSNSQSSKTQNAQYGMLAQSTKPKKYKPVIKLIPDDNDENQKNSHPSIQENKTYQNIPNNSSVKKEMQPHTYELEGIPFPKYLSERKIAGSFPIKAKSRMTMDTSQLIPLSNPIPLELDKEESALIAYTLINVIWSAGNESPIVFEFIQNQEPEGDFQDDKKILEYLFFIGVFGYHNMMLCCTAFRILNVVVNGDEKMDICRLPKKNRLSKIENDIIKNYAEYVVYDINNLSNLAVFSFPLFHDYKYESLACDEDSKILYGLKNIKSRYMEKEKKFGKPIKYVTNSKGLTPFIYLTPIVLTEPPLSSELTSSYCKILNSLYIERFELLKKLTDKLTDKNELEEVVERMKKLDEFYLDYTSYKFKYHGLPGKYNIFELMEKLFPLNPRVFTLRETKLLSRYGDIKETIRKISIESRPLINFGFNKIASLIAQNGFFLTTLETPLLSSKSPNKVPCYTILNDQKEKAEQVKVEEREKMDDDDDNEEEEEEQEQDKYLVQKLIVRYNYILRKSIENKSFAGPRDPNQEINAS